MNGMTKICSVSGLVNGIAQQRVAWSWVCRWERSQQVLAWAHLAAGLGLQSFQSGVFNLVAWAYLAQLEQYQSTSKACVEVLQNFAVQQLHCGSRC